MSAEVNNEGPRPFPVDNLVQFGEWFRAERVSRNLTQSDIANMAGLRRQTVAQLEKGLNVNFETVIRVLKTMGLGMSIERTGSKSILSQLLDGF